MSADNKTAQPHLIREWAAQVTPCGPCFHPLSKVATEAVNNEVKLEQLIEQITTQVTTGSDWIYRRMGYKKCRQAAANHYPRTLACGLAKMAIGRVTLVSPSALFLFVLYNLGL